MQDPADRHVPDWLRPPKEFVAFKKELLNALTCCEVVELPKWNANDAQSLLDVARRNGRSTVIGVSLPSTRSCTQCFMAFEAIESDGQRTYILAFRNDPNCYHDMLSDRSAGRSVIDDKYQVNKSLCRRVATLQEPLRSLPLQWQTGLRERDRLILTGYSVAGAVAAVATFNLLKSEYPHLREQICCYTFGAPLQGGQRYASCINKDYASNFYHVMIEEDTIPRILTLTSKVAVNKPDVARDVVEIICKGLELAATVALNAIVPGAGNAVAAFRGQFDFGKLEDGIKTLVRTERESRIPMPEYSFGGTLVVLDSKHTLNFLPKEFNGMFFFQENVDCLDEKKVLKFLSLKSFSDLIDHVETSNPALTKNSPLTSDEHDGVSRVAKSTTSAVKNVAFSTCIREPEVEEDEKNSPRYLLEPQFDEVTMKVWWDHNENIDIEVDGGENMVLGIHVLYFVDGKEKLRVLCEDLRYMPRSLDDSTGPEPERSSQHALSKLLFRTQGFKGVTFQEPSGCFKVHLAFGESKVIAANRVEKRCRIVDPYVLQSMVQVCELRRWDKNIPILLCITCTDEELARYDDLVEESEDGHEVEDLFKRNFILYREELLEGAAKAAGDAEVQLDDIRSQMQCCCFRLRSKLSEDMVRKLHNLKVRDIEWVKEWCVNELLEIGRRGSSR